MLLLFKFFFCGIISSLIFPPFFLTPLGFIIYPTLFFLINKKEFTNSSFFYHFLSGFLYGLGLFSILLIWIKEPFFINVETSKFSIFSYFLIIYFSLFFGLIFIVINFFNNISIKFILLPATFVLNEIIFANLWYGFPWITHSLIHSANNFGISIIYYFGTYGLSYLTLVIFLFPSIFIFQKKIKFKLFVIFYFLVILFLLILIIMRNSNKENIYSKDIDVSIVQMNFEVNQNLNSANLQNKYDEINNKIISNKSEIIIFAENNYPYLINNNYQLKKIQKNLDPNTSLIMGLTRKEKNKYYNSLYLINDNNIKNFDKKILVPFGEFIPLRKYLSFMEIIAGTHDFAAGSKNRFLNIKDKINIIPVICYEIIFFWKLLNDYNNTADLIINLTNDSWFGNFSGPYQHFYLTRLRAAEYNKPLIRVSNNGISAGIDNFGNIIDYIPLNIAATNNIKIKILKNHKNYLKYHFLIFYIISISFLISLFIKIKYEYRKT